MVKFILQWKETQPNNNKVTCEFVLFHRLMSKHLTVMGLDDKNG